ncbi:MAG: SEL1-like repeat protein [Proteobacteria bacterium]|nr:SEL1-like repeat protein [Pseudomonadota bacterium]
MSSAQSWSVKGIDPKVREAAREAAARQGMSLGEYLNQALANQHPQTPSQAAMTPTPPRARTRFSNLSAEPEDDEDWTISGPSALPRSTDPVRLAQRLESIERRTQLAVSGLDRAVSTIDRSVLGLAARVEDAEAMSGEAADRIADALEQFRHAGDALAGKLDQVEEAKNDFSSVKQRLENQVVVAEEIARRAEAAASYLTTELESRDAELAQTLSQARAVATEAARQANEASADAVTELRRLQEQMSERLAETETSTRRSIASAIQEVRAEQEGETRSTREALLEEVVRLEGEISKRIGAVEDIKTDQSELITRIERAEANAREATAGLRQAAGAAIADLRNSQLTITARLKQVEDGGAAAPDLAGIRQQQQDIAERLAALESKERSPVADALAAFERRIAGIESSGNGQKLEEVDGAVRSLDTALQRLTDRIAETESTANTAIRTLEATVSSLHARVEQAGAAQETEAVRALLEQRLDAMAQSVHQTVGQARSELESQLHAALGGAQGEGLEDALRDVNQRLAAAERRQAQTIEAISLEIKRMSETVDKRLRSVEARNDDAAASAVREELTRMSATLEQRFDEIERREAAAFDRMGLEVGRLSERLEERVGAVEIRSAQAIEHVGEQVARMAERFNQRHDILARDLSERMIDSEERSGARVAEAIGSIMQRLAEVEQHSAEAIAPVQKAVSSVATKLDQFESAHDSRPAHEMLDNIPSPSRRFDDFSAFGEPAPSPMEAAQPVRAAPLPPRADAASVHDDDIYFAEDDLVADAPGHDSFAENIDGAPEAPQSGLEFKSFGSEDDDLLVSDDDGVESFNPPPSEDDPFWSPEDDDAAGVPLSSRHEHHDDTAFAHGGADDFGDDLPLALADAPPLDAAPAEPPPPPGKNDYLAAARRAAQAQSLPKTRADPPPTPQLSLRGSSRIVLWGATAGIAALLIGGSYLYSNSQHTAQPAQPVGDTHPTPPAIETPQPAVDANASDPLAQQGPAAGPNGETLPQTAAPTPDQPAGAAPANAQPAATAAPATQQPTVAGPLAPRSISLEAAAQGGDAIAQYQLALQRLSGGRTADGLGLLRAAANHGLAMAQYRLAKVYERGEGVPADLNTARQWTERAAAAGNRRAMHDLGVYYARGDGAQLDEASAFRWFRQAAELGVADSQYNLGVLYQQGRGVQANAVESLFWFAIAARQGDTDAAARATAEEAQLTTTQVQQARARAQAFRPRAASAVANGDFGQRPWTTGTAAPATPARARH